MLQMGPEPPPPEGWQVTVGYSGSHRWRSVHCHFIFFLALQIFFKVFKAWQ